MARRNLAFYVPDEGGNRLGGSNYEVRVYNGSSKTGAVAATLYADDTTASTIAQPLKPNAGVQSQLLSAASAGATTFTLNDVSGFQVGDEFPIRSGGTQEYRTIIGIVGNQLQVSVGTVNAFGQGSTVGDLMMRGWVNAWVDDSQDYTIELKNVATGRVGPRASVPMKVANADWSKLQTITVAGAPGGISFTGIPTGFKDLELTYDVRSDSAAIFQEVGVRLNADAAANYAFQRMSASGAVQTDTETGAATATSARGWFVTADTSAAGWSGSGRILIPNYQGTTWRKKIQVNWEMLAIAAFPAAGQGFAGETRGFWNFTTAINQVDLVPVAGLFKIGSTATLYGRMG